MVEGSYGLLRMKTTIDWFNSEENIPLKVRLHLSFDEELFRKEKQNDEKRRRQHWFFFLSQNIHLFVFFLVVLLEAVNTQMKCDVSKIFNIFTMGLTMWWLFKIFQFLIDFFFFLSLFNLHFTEHRPHIWERLCENSWIVSLQFKIFQKISVFFTFNKARH